MSIVPVVVSMGGMVLAACGAASHRVWVALPPPGTARLMMASRLTAVVFTYLGLVFLAGPARSTGSRKVHFAVGKW